MAAEKLFETKIKNYLKEQGAYFVKYFANRNTRSGVPDVLCCLNGFFLAIEVKAANGKPSYLQKEHCDQINRACGCAVILYPDQFDEFKGLVEALNHSNQGEAWRLTDKINERSYK